MDPYSQGSLADRAFAETGDLRAEIARLRLVVRMLVATLEQAEQIGPRETQQIERLIGYPENDTAWREYLLPPQRR